MLLLHSTKLIFRVLTLRDVIFKIPTVNFWEIKIYQDICKEIHAIDICLLEVIFLVY